MSFSLTLALWRRGKMTRASSNTICACLKFQWSHEPLAFLAFHATHQSDCDCVRECCTPQLSRFSADEQMRDEKSSMLCSSQCPGIILNFFIDQTILQSEIFYAKQAVGKGSPACRWWVLASQNVYPSHRFFTQEPMIAKRALNRCRELKCRTYTSSSAL